MSRRAFKSITKQESKHKEKCEGECIRYYFQRSTTDISRSSIQNY